MKDKMCNSCAVILEREILIHNVYKTKNAILGKDWYIVDPVGGCQACEVILSEIIKQYKRLEEKTAPWYIRFCRFIRDGFWR